MQADFDLQQRNVNKLQIAHNVNILKVVSDFEERIKKLEEKIKNAD